MPLTEQQIQDKKRRDAAYYARNREKIKQRASQWQKDNPEKCAIKNSRWNKAHREYWRKRAKRYAEMHPERIKAATLKHYHTRIKADPVLKLRRKVQRRQWTLRHPNYQKEHYSRYKLTPTGKAKIRAASLKRRSLKKAATVNLKSITEWIKRIKSQPTAVCYYCEKRIPSNHVHFDHIVALANGGAHSVENLCVSCNSCNSSKGAKPVRAWIRMGQQILEL